MASDKHRVERDRLFGIPHARPAWQQLRDDAHKQEIEKTQRLRAARLAAQRATPSSVVPAPTRVAVPKSRKNVVRVRRAS